MSSTDRWAIPASLSILLQRQRQRDQRVWDVSASGETVLLTISNEREYGTGSRAEMKFGGQTITDEAVFLINTLP